MNKFRWEYLLKKDYDMLCEWWEQWNWPTPPSLDMLPQNAFVIINQNNDPVYAGFLYESGTSIGWLEFIVRNKSLSPQECRGGLDYLVETVSTVAKTRGISALFTSTVNPALVQSLKKTGFEIGDRGSTQLIKQL